MTTSNDSFNHSSSLYPLNRSNSIPSFLTRSGSSPPPGDDDTDYIDRLSPHEPGLPVHLSRSAPRNGEADLKNNRHNLMSNIEVVDSSSSRRRGAAVGSMYAGQVEGSEEDGREDSSGKGSKVKGKWDKLIPHQDNPTTIVSRIFYSLS